MNPIKKTANMVFHLSSSIINTITKQAYVATFFKETEEIVISWGTETQNLFEINNKSDFLLMIFLF